MPVDWIQIEVCKHEHEVQEQYYRDLIENLHTVIHRILHWPIARVECEHEENQEICSQDLQDKKFTEQADQQCEVETSHTEEKGEHESFGSCWVHILVEGPIFTHHLTLLEDLKILKQEDHRADWECQQVYDSHNRHNKV